MFPTCSRKVVLTAIFAVLPLTSGPSWAGLPDYFAFDVQLPSGVTPLVRPSTVYVDQTRGEVYVVDSGNGRIVILDKRGNYLFEFNDRKHMISPRCVVVDSLGQIYVLTSTQTDRLVVFDYDGTYLHDLMLTDQGSGGNVSAASFTMDKSGLLFVLCQEPPAIHEYMTDGRRVNSFPVLEGIKSETPVQEVLGDVAIVNGLILIPLPLISQVAVYRTNGEFVTAFGINGGGPGELSFPISAASDGHDGYFVLDRHRHTILRYGPDFRFIEEFGGLGLGPGWFYFPSSVASDGDGHCFVLQSMNSRLQAIQLPASEKRTGEETKLAQEPASGSPTDK